MSLQGPRIRNFTKEAEISFFFFTDDVNTEKAKIFYIVLVKAKRY